MSHISKLATNFMSSAILWPQVLHAASRSQPAIQVQTYTMALPYPPPALLPTTPPPAASPAPTHHTRQQHPCPQHLHPHPHPAPPILTTPRQQGDDAQCSGPAGCQAQPGPHICQAALGHLAALGVGGLRGRGLQQQQGALFLSVPAQPTSGPHGGVSHNTGPGEKGERPARG